MRTHLRTRAAQAGALLAVVVAGVFAAPALAFASPPDVQITELQTDVQAGASVEMKFRVADTNDNGGRAAATIRVNGGGMNCNGQDCGRVAQIDNGGRDFSVQLTAPNINAGETRQATVTITATVNGEQNQASQQITIAGPDRPEAVQQVSGRIKDQDGKAVAGALVGMQDGTGRSFSTTSDGSGQYSFRSSDSNPIAPGTISIGAGKGGFEDATVQRQAQAGQSVVVALTLKAKVVATTPPTTAPTATASSVPTSDVSVEPAPEDTVATTDPATNNAASEDSGGSMLYIIIGILLVAAGIGAIVLVVLRRRNNDGDDDSSGLAGAGGVVPPSRGGFNDATRVGAPVGGGRANDATMIAPLSGAAPSMADAPTVLQRPVPAEDEFPDPYGVPMPQQGGFAGAAAGGWNDQGNSQQYAGGGTQQYGGGTQQYGGGTQQYGESTQYGRPQDDNNGYGAYSEATGMYRPDAAADDGGYGGYDQGQQYGDQQYGGGQGGYDQGGGYQSGGYAPQQADQGGYGQWGAPGDGIDNNGYGPQGGGQYGGGNYGGGQGGGAYGGNQGGGGQQYGGYDDGGYQGDQRGGYDQAGYDDDQQQYGNQGGYDQRGGGTYGGQPRQDTPGPRRGGRDY